MLSINCECTLSYLKRVENTINLIVLQDELAIILIVDITQETEIKGHPPHVKTCTTELGEYLELQC